MAGVRGTRRERREKGARAPSRAAKRPAANSINKLATLNRRHELLLEAVSAVRDYAIFVLDPEGNILTWNRGAERLKGFKPADIIGRNFSTFYTQPDLDRQHPAYELKEAKKHGRYEEEGWRVRKNGTQFWANVVITKVVDKKGKLIGFTKVTRDLTERRRAEEDLKLARDDLDRRVQERTAELARANERLAERERALEEAVRVRDEFLSIASHELKTPITSLKMQLQILREKTRPETGQAPPPDRLARGMDTSLRQVDRLAALVEDLLDVARAGAKKLTFQFERTELAPLLEDAAQRLADQAQAAGCRLECHAGGKLFADVDRFRLDQVVVNLLMNAFKYAPGTRVRLVAEGRGGRVQIRVQDEGPGIPAELQPRIFERFERGSTSRNISGLGLGLFITKEIVHEHKGSIRVESRPGEGAAFIVDLPEAGSVSVAGELAGGQR